MTEKISILAALERVTEADLEAIDAELAAIEARRLVLQDARRLINAKLHPDRVKRPGGAGKARKKAEAAEESTPRSAAAPPVSVASQVRLLLEAGGPMTPAEIVRQLRAQGKDVSEHGIKIALGRSPHVFAEQPNGRIKLV